MCGKTRGNIKHYGIKLFPKNNINFYSAGHFTNAGIPCSATECEVKHIGGIPLIFNEDRDRQCKDWVQKSLLVYVSICFGEILCYLIVIPLQRK